MVEERRFGLDHPELEQVPASLALLGAEGGTEGVDLAQRHGAGLGVQLPALGEVRLVLVEQVDLEQVRRALHRRGHEEGRVEAHVVAGAEEVVDAALHLVAYTEDGPRRLMPQVQVAVLEEEVDAVLLGRDRVVAACADHLDVNDGELHAAGGAVVGPHVAGDHEARLLS